VVIALLQTVQSFSQQAKKYSAIPLPGMTHMQPAMLSSFGLWLGAFAESLLDDLSIIESAFILNDQSPLGSGAAYGVTLPLDREYSASLLGFAKVQNNALYCQNSRGKIEAAVLNALSQVMATLNKFATDSLIFTTEPFSFISFTKELGTGSSIMPQKQNWDALELMRAKYHQILAAQMQVSTSLANLPSGYNRDLQQAKGSLIYSLDTCISSLKVAQLFINSLKINEEQVNKHIPKELFAAHWAYILVQEKKMPFRQAYMYVKEHLSEIPHFNASEMLPKSVSQGSTGNLGLQELEKNLKYQERQWLQNKNKFEKKINKLINI
jgi:argininosuccinate lyase